MRKRNARRNRGKSPQEIQALLEEYKHSGLTQRKFAQEQAIGYSTLTYWLRQQRQGRYDRKATDWVEVVGSASRPAPRMIHGYTLKSPGGLVLQFGSGFDREELEQLIQLLSTPCSP